MDSNDVGRIAGGIYLALIKGLSEEGARAAHDVLRGLASNPDLQPEDRRIYTCIVHSASTDVDELRAENARLDAIKAGPSLRVIGGNSVTST